MDEKRKSEWHLNNTAPIYYTTWSGSYDPHTLSPTTLIGQANPLAHTQRIPSASFRPWKKRLFYRQPIQTRTCRALQHRRQDAYSILEDKKAVSSFSLFYFCLVWTTCDCQLWWWNCGCDIDARTTGGQRGLGRGHNHSLQEHGHKRDGQTYEQTMNRY